MVWVLVRVKERERENTAQLVFPLITLFSVKRQRILGAEPCWEIHSGFPLTGWLQKIKFKKKSYLDKPPESLRTERLVCKVHASSSSIALFALIPCSSNTAVNGFAY